ncbi:MAG: thymidylate synthase [Thermoproteota archaeon]
MIPVLKVNGKGIAETWENSLIALWRNGIRIKTEYDRENDSPSIDATMIMVVEDPFSEPRIHLCLPAGFKDLRKYVREVLDGVHDHWIDPGGGKWKYTYHQRLFKYPDSRGPVNQIEYIVEKLSKAPYSRRAQAVTWDPGFDPNTDDPPCLQRIWLRCTEEDGVLKLNMNAHWRSRDAYRAAFMNMFALTELQKRIAEMLSERIGRKVLVGQYVDISDSYHIYGSSIEDFHNRFLKALEQRDFYSSDIRKSRTVSSDHPMVKRGFSEADLELEAEEKSCINR